MKINHPKRYRKKFACCTYALCCPITGFVRYIGYTKNIKRIINEHIYLSNRPSCHNIFLSKWICTLAVYGLKPVCRILCYSDREINYIDYYCKRKSKANLFNACYYQGEGKLDSTLFFTELFNKIKTDLNYTKKNETN